ncbi:MAG TPA: selenium metabolism-associated LysR family transcriptional regulator [Syntrophales bacterium]|mgnify:CR=1 FL=1|nr:selenium metabolism-associated LysR family transcriptional regulator [Syntrophales bacterium]
MERKLKNVTLQQLEGLLLLVENRSFSKAAEKMFMTQPSLTKHIRNLEEEAGSKVVDRKSRLLSPTTEGKILYDCARRIFRLLEDAGERLERERASLSGDIRVSASTIPATYILPAVLRDFLEKEDAIRVHVEMNDSGKTIGMVLDEEVELGLVGMPANHRKLREEPLWKDALAIVVSRDHPLSKRKTVTLEELAREPFISREQGSATRALFEACLTERGEKKLSRFNVVCELGSSEAVKEAVLAGVGFSVLSIHAVRRELKDGTLHRVPLRDCPLERHFYLIYRKNREFMPYHRVFMAFLRRSAVEQGTAGG